MPERKTATIELNPDHWSPILEWFIHQERIGNADQLGAHEETLQLLQVIRRRARPRFRKNQNATLRANLGQLEILYQDLRFWECCGDELPRPRREGMPPWRYFNAAAVELEGDLKVIYWKEQNRKPARKSTLQIRWKD